MADQSIQLEAAIEDAVWRALDAGISKKRIHEVVDQAIEEADADAWAVPR